VLLLPELLIALSKAQIALSLKAGELHVRAPRGTLTPELQAGIRVHREALRQYLAQTSSELKFSLFFFGKADYTHSDSVYEDLFKTVRQAEAGGFVGVWTPERHFDDLGGFFPSPAVLAAALARETQTLKLRAGSVVLPLNNPIRVAEDWAVVDHLSAGRVELSFATGWHSNDFALAPENYGQRHDLLYPRIEEVRKLWRGQSLPRREGSGSQIQIQTHPRPLQKELTVWITAIGNPESYRKIGNAGANLLTCLLDQEVEELAEKLKIYRQALSDAGHDPAQFQVCVFLHTFLGQDLDAVRGIVSEPFKDYLRSSLHLLGKISQSAGLSLNPADFTAEDTDVLLDFAFERYFSRRALMGTPETVKPLLNELQAAGVNEIACLVDFGPSHEQIQQSLAVLTSHFTHQPMT
jgi:natural product biosynthesis luciferase-like monooxygenase protein